jgi:hypothetical protein
MYTAAHASDISEPSLHYNKIAAGLEYDAQAAARSCTATGEYDASRLKVHSAAVGGLCSGGGGGVSRVRTPEPVCASRVPRTPSTRRIGVVPGLEHHAAAGRPVSPFGAPRRPPPPPASPVPGG